MALTTGQRLQEARLIRGLSIEDVQHRTHIRAAQIAAMENDDLGVFPSPVYARGFYANYARFLDVDLAGFLETLAPHRTRARQSYPLLRPLAVARPATRTGRLKPGDPPPGPARLALVGIAAVVVVTATAWFGHLWSRRNDSRLDAASVTGTSANLPIMTGASSSGTPAPQAPQPDPGLAGTTPAPATPPTDLRSTPPPVLKALPVDDAGGPLSHESPRERSAPPADTEIRRPAPITR
jgi:cytoskeletal protein RodZ